MESITTTAQKPLYDTKFIDISCHSRASTTCVFWWSDVFPKQIPVFISYTLMLQ
jgi:hypothetical protein